MTRLYLIRHCEAYGNIHRRLDGVRDTDITALGEKQIGYLAERFRNESIDAVYSSELVRAVKTAAGIAAVTGAVHIRINDLHEREMGFFEGRSWYEVKAIFPEVFRSWQADFNGFVLPEGESFHGGGERLAVCLDRLCKENEGKTIAVVSHSMVIKAFLESLRDWENVPFGNNTAVSYLEVSDGKYAVRYINDDSYLPEEIRIERQRWAKGGAKLEDYSLRYVYEYEKELRSTVCGHDAVCVRAYEHDVPVGHMVFCPHEDTAEVERLYVQPELRRQGFATQLIGEALYSAKRLGYRQLRLAVPRFDEAVAGLIHKNGLLTMGNFAYILFE